MEFEHQETTNYSFNNIQSPLKVPYINARYGTLTLDHSMASHSIETEDIAKLAC